MMRVGAEIWADRTSSSAKLRFFFVHVNDPSLGFLLGWHKGGAVVIVEVVFSLDLVFFFCVFCCLCFLPLYCSLCKSWNFVHGCEILVILWVLGQRVFDFGFDFDFCVFGSWILEFGLMGSDIDVVKASCVHEWKKGWPLRSGGFAQLCCKCG